MLWRTSQQVYWLCPWARHLTGRPTFKWKTGPKQLRNSNSQASVNILSKTQGYNSFFCEWRINMANKEKAMGSTIMSITENCIYRIFWTIGCTYNSSMFSKMEHVPYSLVHLTCGSGCTLSPSSEQILFCWFQVVMIDRERIISEKQNIKASPKGTRLPKEAMPLRDIFKFAKDVAVSAINTIVPTSTHSFLRANFFFSCNQITHFYFLYKCVFVFKIQV